MFENLLELVKQNAGDAIVNNNQIPNEHNDAVIKTSAESIMSSLQNQASGGNLQNIMSLFSNGGSLQNNPIVNNIGQNTISDLMTKHGISENVAQGVVSSLIPVVMNQLVQKTNNPSDNSFDLNGIMGMLGGNGGTSGIIGNVLGGLFK